MEVIDAHYREEEEPSWPPTEDEWRDAFERVDAGSFLGHLFVVEVRDEDEWDSDLFGLARGNGRPLPLPSQMDLSTTYSPPPSYAELGGLTVRVTGVCAQKYGHFVSLIVENGQGIESGATYTATCENANLGLRSTLVLGRNLALARRRLIGKTVWFRDKYLDEVPDYAPQSIPRGEAFELPPLAPLRVLDILPGTVQFGSQCVLLLQNDDGLVGSISTRFGPTNDSDFILPYTESFEDMFLLEDPKKTHDWPERVWASIAQGSVFIGMTRQQVEFAWGRPNDINRTAYATTVHEQWVYPGAYLYFQDDVLEAIQD